MAMSADNNTDEGAERGLMPAAEGSNGSDQQFRGRLDQLLADALTEQAREQAAFMRVLQSSRDALAATRVELDAVRAFVEARDVRMVEVLDTRLAAVAQEASLAGLAERIAALETEQAALKRTLSVKLESIAGSLEAIEWRSQEALAPLAARLGDAETATQAAERTAALEEHLSGMAKAVETRQEEVAGAVLQALEPIARIMQIVQGRVATAASELAEAQSSLFAQLAERDSRLLAELAGGMKPRDRKRAAEAFAKAEQERLKAVGEEARRSEGAVPVAPAPARQERRRQRPDV